MLAPPRAAVTNPTQPCRLMTEPPLALFLFWKSVMTALASEDAREDNMRDAGT